MALLSMYAMPCADVYRLPFGEIKSKSWGAIAFFGFRNAIEEATPTFFRKKWHQKHLGLVAASSLLYPKDCHVVLLGDIVSLHSKNFLAMTTIRVLLLMEGRSPEVSVFLLPPSSARDPRAELVKKKKGFTDF